MSQQPQTATRQDEPLRPAPAAPGTSDGVGAGGSAGASSANGNGGSSGPSGSGTASGSNSASGDGGASTASAASALRGSSGSGTANGPSGSGAALARRARLRDLPRPGWLDVLAAALTGYVAVWNNPDGTRGLLPVLHQCPEACLEVVWAAVVLLCCSGILLRRVVPVTAVLVLTGALGTHLLLFGEASLAALISCLVLAETCTSRLARPWSGLLLAACYLGAALSVLWIGYLGGEEQLEPVRALTLVGMVSTVLTVAALTGLLRRRSREKVEQALERAAVLAAQQDAERRLAVVRERQRIARDVHDLLGHSLSVIGIQAAGARAVLPSDPAAVDQALAVIGETSRNAVDEVRALVDVLRADEDLPGPAEASTLPGETGKPGETGEPGRAALASRGDDGASGPLPADGPRPAGGSGGTGGLPPAGGPGAAGALAPAAAQAGGGAGAAVGPVEQTGAGGRLPGLEGLPALLAGARRAGLPVRSSLEQCADTSQPVAEAVYRLVQESLTNVLRHADGAQTHVTVRVGEQEVEAVVTNEAAPRACPAQDGTGREGTGLAAMRERVTNLGGQVQAGPTSSGGWQVRARLPRTGGQATGAQGEQLAADAGRPGTDSLQAGTEEGAP